MKELVLLTCMLALLATVSAFHNESNCTEAFHTVLKKAAEVKSHCNIRGFYDCCEAKEAAKLVHFDNSASGIYDVINVCSSEEEDSGNDSIQPPMRVLCDMDSDGGGWLVIMKRKRNAMDMNFNRLWDQYENGFGTLGSEFWLGLRNIHCLTRRGEVDLMIDLRQADGNGMTWIYHDFKVNGSNDKYRLQVGESEGPPGANDAMFYHNGRQFTTRDSDNDLNVVNCAFRHRAGWWYNPECLSNGALLTGYHVDSYRVDQLQWYLGRRDGYKYYQNVEMKVRPKSCGSVSICTGKP